MTTAALGTAEDAAAARTRRRFELAVESFTRSYTSCRRTSARSRRGSPPLSARISACRGVYREVQLSKADHFDPTPASGFEMLIVAGDDLLTDLCVSW